MRDRHVFRGGTSVDDDKERREYYINLIAICKEEREGATSTRKKRKRVVKKKRIDLVGRRVVMSADVFGGSENQVYHGLIVRKARYSQRGNVKHGYAVK